MGTIVDTSKAAFNNPDILWYCNISKPNRLGTRCPIAIFSLVLKGLGMPSQTCQFLIPHLLVLERTGIQISTQSVKIMRWIFRCQAKIGQKQALKNETCLRYFDDLMECRYKLKTRKRYMAMLAERQKQGRPQLPAPPMDSIKTSVGMD